MSSARSDPSSSSASPYSFFVAVLQLETDLPRERWACTRGGHRDREVPLPHDRRKDEVVELRHVDDVAEHSAPLRIGEDSPFAQVGPFAGDHEEATVQVRRPALAQLEPDLLSAAQRRTCSVALERDDADLRTSVQEAATFPDFPRADHERSPSDQVEDRWIVAASQCRPRLRQRSSSRGRPSPFALSLSAAVPRSGALGKLGELLEPILLETGAHDRYVDDQRDDDTA